MLRFGQEEKRRKEERKEIDFGFVINHGVIFFSLWVSLLSFILIF